jgi:hypothetical protein
LRASVSRPSRASTSVAPKEFLCANLLVKR